MSDAEVWGECGLHGPRATVGRCRVRLSEWVHGRSAAGLHRFVVGGDWCPCVILTDFDACVSQPCHAQATCTDLAAPSLDRSCACNTGYQGDGAAVCSGMMCISHACFVSLAQISTRVSASRAVPTACAVIFQRRRCSAHASVPSATGRLTAASRACRVWCARLVCR